MRSWPSKRVLESGRRGTSPVLSGGGALTGGSPADRMGAGVVSSEF
jgi:hypothetical protein